MGRYRILIILAFMLSAVGCTDFGEVDQGRVIVYDKHEKAIVMIRDKSSDPKRPDYTELPTVTYKLPVDPKETGPAPTAGKLMMIDLDKKEAAIFVEHLNAIESVNYTLIEQKKVDSKDPLVYDPATKKIKPFPIVDVQAKSIKIYLEKMKTLLTFSVPDRYFGLPPDTWAMGDEVRIYYKEPGKSSRFMNVTRTDIFKK